jgi:hypothetical protein
MADRDDLWPRTHTSSLSPESESRGLNLLAMGVQYAPRASCSDRQPPGPPSTTPARRLITHGRARIHAIVPVHAQPHQVRQPEVDREIPRGVRWDGAGNQYCDPGFWG